MLCRQDRRALGQAAGYLQEGPKTIEQLVAHRPLYLLGFHLPCVESAEHLSIGMHLDELLAQGQVVQGLDGLWSLR